MRILTIALLSLSSLCAYAAGNKYALLVQVTHYKEQATKQNPHGIPSYVGKDPREVDNTDVRMMESAIRRFGFNAIEKLVDAQATRKAILEKMNEITRHAQPGDVVLFYFTGHGAAAKSGFTIVPYDADPKSADNDISSDELYLWASRLRAQHIVIVLDSCFHHDPKRYPDGMNSNGEHFGDKPPSTRPKMIEGRFDGIPQGWGRIASVPNTVVITASDMGQKAYQAYRTKQNGRDQWVGAFTWCLCETLQSKDLNPRTTYTELIETLRERLNQYVADARLHTKAFQSPQLLGDAALHSRPIFEPSPLSSPSSPLPPSSPPSSPAPSVVKIFFDANVPDHTHETIHRMYREFSKTPVRVYDPKTADVIVRFKDGILTILLPTEGSDIPSSPEPPTPTPIVNHPILKQLVENAGRTNQWLSVSLDKSSYSVGDAMRVTVRLERPGYMILVSEDSSGTPSIMYPYGGSAPRTPEGVYIFPDREGIRYIVNKGSTNAVIAVLLKEETDYHTLLSLLRGARSVEINIRFDELLRSWVDKELCSIRYCVITYK